MIECRGSVISYNVEKKTGQMRLFLYDGQNSLEEMDPIGFYNFCERDLSSMYQRQTVAEGDKVILYLKDYSETDSSNYDSSSIVNKIILVRRRSLVDRSDCG